jgi:hypothetical protein
MKMSSSMNALGRARNFVGAVALGAALVCGLTPASAAGAPSSPEERQRFVSITHKLEQAPLDPGLQADRAWALQWLTDVPDISVEICVETLSGMLHGHYEYGGQISLQDSFSIAAFMIEHPDSANDRNAQEMAGLQASLNAYRAILRDKPDAKSRALDDLLETQARGELPEYIRKALIRCAKTK